MKNLFLAAMLLIGGYTMAQSSFGIKGGLNYGATGEYRTISEGVEDVMTIEGENNTGYHLGFFGRFGVLGFFLQPEIIYTRLNTDYDLFQYTIQKIDAPVLVGVNVFGPVNIKAGPSFQYILNNDLEDSNLRISEVENEITLGYQLGAGINIGRVGLDIRYEGAFTENTAFSDTANENFSIDSRPSQWIFSAAYSF